MQRFYFVSTYVGSFFFLKKKEGKKGRRKENIDTGLASAGRQRFWKSLKSTSEPYRNQIVTKSTEYALRRY